MIEGAQSEAAEHHTLVPLPPGHVLLDPRTRHVLDGEPCFRVVEGSLDLLGFLTAEGSTQTPQNHLFRVDAGDLVLPFPDGANSELTLRVVAVGAPHAQLLPIRRSEIADDVRLASWIAQVARLLCSN